MADESDIVRFRVTSKIGINTEIVLPLKLVEDLEKHMNDTYPLPVMVNNALLTYLQYVNGDLVNFNDFKDIILACLNNTDAGEVGTID